MLNDKQKQRDALQHPPMTYHYISRILLILIHLILDSDMLFIIIWILKNRKISIRQSPNISITRRSLRIIVSICVHAFMRG